MRQIVFTVTLCYQFDSDHYDSTDLKACVERAVDEADQSIGEYNVVYDSIEEIRSGFISENIKETIQKADIVIVENSDQNQNVLLELGMAIGLEKQLIIPREKSASNEVPFNIRHLSYLTYAKDRLGTFHYELARQLKKAVQSLPKESYVPEEILIEYLERHFLPLETSVEVADHLATVFRECKREMYYIGSGGFLTNESQWLDHYKEYLGDPAFCRIVFIRSLKEVWDEYKDSTFVEKHCLWLSQYYKLIKEGFVTLYLSSEVGSSKKGMSMVITDEENVLIMAGKHDDFNRKGIFIQSPKVGAIFKEHARSLALTSERIQYTEMAKYFSLSTSREEVPRFLEEWMKEGDVSDLKESCIVYVRDELSKL